MHTNHVDRLLIKGMNDQFDTQDCRCLDVELIVETVVDLEMDPCLKVAVIERLSTYV
jgi:hypothetical protein